MSALVPIALLLLSHHAAGQACSKGPSSGTDGHAAYGECDMKMSGELCIPRCAEGYTVMGSFVLNCVNLHYDATGARCNPNPCTGGPKGGTEDPDGTYTSCNTLVTGQTCTPSCRSGGSSNVLNLICDHNGQFDASAARCSAVQCTGGPTGGQPNVDYSPCNALFSGQLCTPQCVNGYSQSGSGFVLACDVMTKQYAPPAGFTCAANPCTNPNSPMATVDYSPCHTLKTGQTCTITCITGYSGGGTFPLICSATGQYDATASCTPNACSTADTAIANSDFSPCNTLVTGERCIATCKPGYTATAKPFLLTCSSTGRYTPPADSVSCTPTPCSGGPISSADINVDYRPCNVRMTGDTCTPACNPGFSLRMAVTFTLTCTGGTYPTTNVPPMTCDPYPCTGGPVTRQPNVDYSACDMLRSGQQCAPVCPSGYTISGSFTLVCSAANTYTSSVSCKPNPCTGGPVPPFDPNADYTSCNAMSTGQTCTPVCAKGYTLSATFPLVCNGGYSTSGQCTPNQCTGGPTSGIDPNAVYTACSMLRSGQVCVPVCQTGYSLSGSFILECVGAGQNYDASGATCTANSCSVGGRTGTTDAVASYTECNKMTTGQSCVPVCPEGYTASGAIALVCVSTGYDASGARCVPNSCANGPTAPDPNTVYTACNMMTTGQVCTPTCRTGYSLSGGGMQLVCTATKQYTAGMFCRPSQCTAPNTPVANADYSDCNGKVTGQVCTPSCTKGYQATASPTTLLCSSGRYTAQITCTPNACSRGPTNPLPDVVYSPCNSMQTGQVCLPQCALPGYGVTAGFALECDTQGRYPVNGGACEPLSCTTPTNTDPNANYMPCNSQRTASTCSPLCDAGYVLVRQLTLVCDAGGTYDAGGTICSDCTGGPTNPDPNAVYTACNAMKSGEVCVPSCKEGFHTTASITLACTMTKYDVGTAACEPNDCTNGPAVAPDNITQYSGCNTLRTGDTCTPSCPKGYAPPLPFTLLCSSSNSYQATGKCTPYTCTTPTAPPAHSDYTSCQGKKTGETCRPQCEDGYRDPGSLETLVCSDTGEFVPSKATHCIPNDCKGGPRTGTDGNMFYNKCNALVTGENCVPQCLNGYAQSGSFKLVCSSQNTYNATGASCTPYVCTKGPHISNPNATYKDCVNLQTGDLCSPVCTETGYTFPPFPLVCLQDGTFNGSGECLPNKCTEPLTPDNSSATTCAGKVTGEECAPSCLPGYTFPSPPFTLVCDPSGKYPQKETCTPNSQIRCFGGPSNPAPNVVYDACNALVNNDLCTPVCAEGYARTAGTTFALSCRGNQYLDHSNTVCTPNPCASGAAAPDPHASYPGCSAMVSGQQCEARCREGYEGGGTFPLKCDPSGFFSVVTVPTCTPTQCSGGPFQRAANTIYDKCNARRSGEMCTPECPDGWSLQGGGFTLLCTGSPPKYNASVASVFCRRNGCGNGPLATGMDGYADYSECLLMVTGQQCSPKCTDGTVLTGKIDPLVCNDDQQFDASGASCLRICGLRSTCPAVPSACQTTACSPSNQCVVGVRPVGTACDDGVLNTVSDACAAGGVCRGIDACRGVVCSTPPCHLPVTCRRGVCQTPVPSPNNTPCDDGNPATLNDVCTNGVCKGTDLCQQGCRAVDQCHGVGTCSSASGGRCTEPLLADGTQCDDGNPATTADKCTNGTCRGVVVCGGTVCPDTGHPCSAPSCVANTCRTITLHGTTCNDGAITTVNDRCVHGVCRGTDYCDAVRCTTPVNQCLQPTGKCVYSAVAPFFSCVYPSVPDGTPCDDGNPSTWHDNCVNGACQGEVRVCPSSCTPLSPCHLAGTCTAGQCSNPLAPNGTTCNDGLVTTNQDSCQQGWCRGGVPCGQQLCFPPTPCHYSLCSSSKCLVLQHPDGTECPLADGRGVCQGGVCVRNVSVVCCNGVSLANPCRIYACDVDRSCLVQNVPPGTVCDDKNNITINDRCINGVCVGERRCANVQCQASDECHDVGRCDEETGLCTDPPKPDGTLCRSGGECNNGVCVVALSCGGSTCTSYSPCLTPVCSNTQCIVTPLPDGTSCNDNNTATEADTCTAGVCSGTDPCDTIVCAPIDQCHESGVCSNGKCSTPLRPDGTPCDDQDPSTVLDTCTQGLCRGVAKCEGVACRSTTCMLVHGCRDGKCLSAPQAEGLPCDDQNTLTVTSVCRQGECVGTVNCGTTVCTAKGQCYLPVCGANGLCEQVPRTGSCDDMDPLTEGDTCVIGVCQGRDPCRGVRCEAVSPCHEQGECVRGRCTTPLKPDNTVCDDGNPDTIHDRCVGGVCKGKGRCEGVVCGQSDECHFRGVCSQGVCTDPAKEIGSACNDGNPTTSGDVCRGDSPASHVRWCSGELACGGRICVATGSCYTPHCNGTVCIQIPKAAGTPCNDGDPKTNNDMCYGNGVCRGVDPAAGVSCPAISQCHLPGTPDASGRCSTPLRPDTAPCDDGLPETKNDQCTGGVCKGVPQCDGVVCRGGDCFNSTCDNGVCLDTVAADGTPCPSGTCYQGVCQTCPLCPPVPHCRTAICTANSTNCRSLAAPDGTQCSDANPYTTGDRCIAGVCVGIAVCDAASCPATAPSPCHDVECVTGSCETPIKPNYTRCDDGSTLTVDDVCIDGVCRGVDLCVNTSCAAVQHLECTLLGPRCDSATGRCIETFRETGTPCNAGSGTCDGKGSCRVPCGSTTCSSSQCSTATCVTGRCVASPLPDGTACNDNNTGTVDDRCENGVCKGRDACLGVACPVPSPCYTPGRCVMGRCTPPLLLPDGTPCDDGNATTLGDTCRKGQCGGGPSPPQTCLRFPCSPRRPRPNAHTIRCDAGCNATVCCECECGGADQCNNDGVCGANGKCIESPKPDGTPCVEGHTGTGECQNGVCVGTVQCGMFACKATDPVCSFPSCDGGTCKEVQKPDGARCNDRNATTVNDVCVKGTCRGVSLCDGVVCTPSDACHAPGTCDPATGLCSDPRLPDGTQCGKAGECRGGACLEKEPCGCYAKDQCSTCCPPGAKPDGTPCNDENPRTTLDQCSGGVCLGVDACDVTTCLPPTQCHTSGSCTSGICTPRFKPDGMPCDDMNNRTVNDMCIGGQCIGTDKCGGVTCSATGPCFEEQCHPSTGSCERVPLNVGKSCDDGNPQTVRDMCGDDGWCRGEVVCGSKVCGRSTLCNAVSCGGTGDQCITTPLPCDDQCAGITCRAASPCHAVRCDKGVCVQTMLPNNSACDDGSPLTVGDVCSNGVCRGENLCANVTCGTGQGQDPVCLTSRCNPATGTCMAVYYDDAPCDDNNTLTVNDRCASGVCVGGVVCGSAICQERSPCRTASCAAGQAGCAFAEKPPGTPCDDLNPTTTNDACQRGGTCAGVDPCLGVVCAPIDQCHARGTCLLGHCSTPLIQDGTPCDDGDPTTHSSVCKNGMCTGGVRKCDGVTCTASDACHAVGVCDEQTGLCTDPTLADGTPCGTGKVCHLGRCTAQCGGEVCKSVHPCLEASCTPSCQYTVVADGVPCNDGNSSTIDDRCQAGVCRGTPPQCSCPTVKGMCQRAECQGGMCEVVNLPDDSPCDDGEAGTAWDTCKAGVCVGNSTCKGVICRQLPCHTPPRCDASKGSCTSDPLRDGVPCDDGNPESTGDVCLRGVCAGVTKCGGAQCSPPTACYTAGCRDGGCAFFAKSDGEWCDDGRVETIDDQCIGGECRGKDLCESVVCPSPTPCSKWVCLHGGCVQQLHRDGTACDDKNPLTYFDSCKMGVCEGTVVECSACTPTPCSDTWCSKGDGLCRETPHPDGTPCDDKDPDTLGDTCSKGVCLGSIQCGGALCRPLGQCHTVRCTGNVCQQLLRNDGSPCNDGDPTTGDDVCRNGECRGTSPCERMGCSPTPLHPCFSPPKCVVVREGGGGLKGVCESAALPDFSFCDDQDPSTTDDRCINGTCLGTRPSPPKQTCSAPCVFSSCVPKPDGATCDDGDPTTTNDVCQQGTCKGACRGQCAFPIRQGRCYKCNCADTPLPDGTPCHNGVTASTCSGGVCLATPQTPTQCPPSTTCGVGGVAVQGVCEPRLPKPDTTPCDDLDPLTTDDVCRKGECRGVPRCQAASPCTASDVCHDVGVCNNQTGLCTDPVKPDGTPCGGNLACWSGVCGGTPPCHRCNDTANPTCREPDGTPCNDGNPLTASSVCRKGECVGVAVCAGVYCPPLSPCHSEGKCDVATGRCEAVMRQDGEACTVGGLNGTCTKGECVVDPCDGVVCDTAPSLCHHATGWCRGGLCFYPKRDDGIPCGGSSGLCSNGSCVQVVTCGTSRCMPATACHRAACGATCESIPLSGVPCDDGDPTTYRDQCVRGVCVAGPACGPCPATNNPCQKAVPQCNATTVRCTVEPLADGTPCNGGRCLGGACRGGCPGCYPISQCHRTECREGQCIQVPLPPNTPCDDGNNATVRDVCRGGGECRGEACDGDCLISCFQFKPDGTFCGNGGSCLGGRCILPVPCLNTVCNVTSPCQDPICVVGRACGVQFASDGTVCGSGKECLRGACTPIDRCKEKLCPPLQHPHCQRQAPCQNGVCRVTTLADGIPCGAIAGWECMGGVCRPKAARPPACDSYPIPCPLNMVLHPNPSNVVCPLAGCDDTTCCVPDLCLNVVCKQLGPHGCLNNTCDVLTGKCLMRAVADDTPCDDGSSTTVNDSCSTGRCIGSVVCNNVVCTRDTNPCSFTACDPGCKTDLRYDGTPCDDGNDRTWDDQCLGGKCVGKDKCENVKCDDPRPCHLPGTCDPVTGLCSEPLAPDGTACFASSASNSRIMYCRNGTCQPSVQCASGSDCTAAESCQRGACVNQQCVAVPAANGTECTDNNPLTFRDTCLRGKCVGEDKCAGVVCAQDDQCHAVGECDPGTGLCTTPKLPDGTPCSLGKASNLRTVCMAGGCIPQGYCNGVTCRPTKPKCQVARCDGNRCARSVMPNGSPCNDENPLTMVDTCNEGECVGQDLCARSQCRSPNPCQREGTCDVRTGLCNYPPLPEGSPCSDGNHLTTGDACFGGVCLGEVRCGNTTCRATGVCRYPNCSSGVCTEVTKPDGTACDDMDSATIKDRCLAGECKGQGICEGIVCTPTSDCVSSKCWLVTGACVESPKADGTGCDDGDAATVDDACVAGVCVGGVPCGGSTCLPADPQCQTATCNSGQACTMQNLPEGTTCRGGSCRSGRCVGSSKVCGTCPASPSPCFESYCNHVTAECATRPRPHGTPCDDGQSATIHDQCREGACVGTVECGGAVCTVTDPLQLQCHVASCQSGTCTTRPKLDGTACDDGDPATTSDVCVGGKCVGEALCDTVVCPDKGECSKTSRCTRGMCVTTPLPTGTPCDDRIAETTNDTCIQGACIGAVPCGSLLCRPTSPCRFPVCENMACREESFPDGAQCDDLDPTTAEDYCQLGVCVGKNLCRGVRCPPVLSECLLPATCNPGTGKCTSHSPKPDGTLCSGGTCRGGWCVPSLACGGVPCDIADGSRSGTAQCLRALCSQSTLQCNTTAVPDGTPCDDFNMATSGDMCKDGRCVGIDKCRSVQCTPGPCQQGGVCRDGLCFFSPKPDGETCTTGHPSAVEGKCMGGKCVNVEICGGSKRCYPASDCLLAKCDGTACAAQAKFNGTLCDDANPRTVNDICLQGHCSGRDLCVGVVCTPSDECHVAGVCDPLTGVCTDPPAVDGTACTDTRSNMSSTCSGGVCQHGAVTCTGVVCNKATSPCKAVSCDAGACRETNVPDGTACNDGDMMTVDSCQAGVCVGKGLCDGVTCTPVPCRAVACNPATGKCDSSPLPDGSVCPATGNRRVCMAGSCVEIVTCSGKMCLPSDPQCLRAACIGGTCQDAFVADGQSCSDWDPFTDSDQCTAGVCKGTGKCAGTTCSKQCHTGSCNERTGLCEYRRNANGTSCNDGIARTNADICIDGMCVGRVLCGGVICKEPGDCYEMTCEADTCRQRPVADGRSCGASLICLNGYCLPETGDRRLDECIKNNATCQQRGQYCVDTNRTTYSQTDWECRCAAPFQGVQRVGLVPLCYTPSTTPTDRTEITVGIDPDAVKALSDGDPRGNLAALGDAIAASLGVTPTRVKVQGVDGDTVKVSFYGNFQGDSKSGRAVSNDFLGKVLAAAVPGVATIDYPATQCEALVHSTGCKGKEGCSWDESGGACALAAAESSSSSDDNNTALKVVLVVLIVLMVACIAFYFLRNRCKKQQGDRAHLAPTPLDAPMAGDSDGTKELTAIGKEPAPVPIKDINDDFDDLVDGGDDGGYNAPPLPLPESGMRSEVLQPPPIQGTMRSSVPTRSGQFTSLRSVSPSQRLPSVGRGGTVDAYSDLLYTLNSPPRRGHVSHLSPSLKTPSPDTRIPTYHTPPDPLVGDILDTPPSSPLQRLPV